MKISDSYSKKYLSSTYPAISGILANISKGRKWTDSTHMPGIYVAYSYCVGGYGVAGDIQKYKDEEIKKFFDSVFCDIRQDGEECFEFSSEDPSICDKILQLYAHKKPNSEIEYSLRGKYKLDETIDVPENIKICQVDKDLVKQMRDGTIINGDMFFERFNNSWYDEDSFYNNSASFVAISNGSVVGIILGSSCYEKVVSIDIEVEEEYRRQNIAKRLTRDMLNYLIDRGYVLQWDCTESNEISYKMARSMGFEQIKERPYYWFEI